VAIKIAEMGWGVVKFYVLNSFDLHTAMQQRLPSIELTWQHLLYTDARTRTPQHNPTLAQQNP
jgi:hypothetical protein